jgi:acyl-CoA thioesterase-1
MSCSRKIFGFLILVLFSQLAWSQSQLSSTQTSQKVLVLGDSLSAAYEIRPEFGWVQLLADQLDNGQTSVSLNNASFGGATTASGVQRLPGLLDQHQPDLLVLELGANDGLQGKPVPYIKQNLARMIEQAQARQIQVVLLGIRLPPNYGSRYTEPFFNQYAELAREYNLLYVPFMLEGIADQKELMRDDGLHPTEQAQPMILDNIWPTVQQALNTISQ